MTYEQLNNGFCKEKFKTYLMQTAEFLSLAHQTFYEYVRSISDGSMLPEEVYSDFQIVKQHILQKLTCTDYLEQ